MSSSNLLYNTIEYGHKYKFECINYFQSDYRADELFLCSHEFDHNIVETTNFFDKTNPARWARLCKRRTLHKISYCDEYGKLVLTAVSNVNSMQVTI